MNVWNSINNIWKWIDSMWSWILRIRSKQAADEVKIADLDTRVTALEQAPPGAVSRPLVSLGPTRKQ